ncbi:MAG: hypothetical protein MJ070_00780 [Lachnospiraceae bacterium]|nr:hypothetical protein [Lachnospiraceae bacterium]
MSRFGKKDYREVLAETVLAAEGIDFDEVPAEEPEKEAPVLNDEDIAENLNIGEETAKNNSPEAEAKKRRAEERRANRMNTVLNGVRSELKYYVSLENAQEREVESLTPNEVDVVLDKNGVIFGYHPAIGIVPFAKDKDGELMTGDELLASVETAISQSEPEKVGFFSRMLNYIGIKTSEQRAYEAAVERQNARKASFETLKAAMKDFTDPEKVLAKKEEEKKNPPVPSPAAGEISRLIKKNPQLYRITYGVSGKTGDPRDMSPEEMDRSFRYMTGKKNLSELTDAEAKELADGLSRWLDEETEDGDLTNRQVMWEGAGKQQTKDFIDGMSGKDLLNYMIGNQLTFLAQCEGKFPKDKWPEGWAEKRANRNVAKEQSDAAYRSLDDETLTGEALGDAMARILVSALMKKNGVVCRDETVYEEAVEKIKQSEAFKNCMEPDENGVSYFDRQRAAMSAARAAGDDNGKKLLGVLEADLVQRVSGIDKLKAAAQTVEEPPVLTVEKSAPDEGIQP